jgi:hypothetical protein
VNCAGSGLRGAGGRMPIEEIKIQQREYRDCGDGNQQRPLGGEVKWQGQPSMHAVHENRRLQWPFRDSHA